MGEYARRLALAIDGSKPQVTTYRVDLTALPTTTLHEPLDAKSAAKLDRKKLTVDPDLKGQPANGYARSYMMSFSFNDTAKFTYAHVKLQGQYGASEGWFGKGYGTALSTYQSCDTTFKDLVPIHWESVTIEDQQVKYTVTDSVLDRSTCQVLRVRRSEAQARPLLPRGILYGFRSCVGSCVEDEQLTLLFPRSSAAAAGALGGAPERSTGAFSFVSFSVQRGGGGAFMARIAKYDAAQWQIKTRKDPKKHPHFQANPLSLPSAVASFQLGVEVSQAHDDPAPIAIAYLDIDPELLPPLLPSADLDDDVPPLDDDDILESRN